MVHLASGFARQRNRLGTFACTTSVGPGATNLVTGAAGATNDCLRPVSRFYDRIERPEQLIPAALEAMRVLTDPAETGAVTLALPEDVQVRGIRLPGRVPAAARVEGRPTATGTRGPGPLRRADPARAAAVDCRGRWRHL